MTDVRRMAPDYQPYVAGSFRWRLALRPLDLDDWIQIGHDYDHEMDRKSWVLDNHYDTAVAVLPGIEHEAVLPEHRGAAARLLELLEDADPIAARAEPDRGGESAQPAADHHGMGTAVRLAGGGRRMSDVCKHRLTVETVRAALARGWRSGAPG